MLQRRPYGEFTPAPCGANQQQVGDICARNQEHQVHRPQHHQQRLARVANNHVAQRLDRKYLLWSEPTRVAAAELIGGNLQQGVGLGQGDAGLEPRGGAEVVALVGAVGIELKGKQDVCFCVGDE